MAQPLSLEENEELAPLLKSMLETAEQIDARFGVDRLKETSKNMHNQASRAMSASVITGPTGLNEAESLMAITKIFDALIDFVDARSKQIELAHTHHKKATSLSSLLKLIPND